MLSSVWRHRTIWFGLGLLIGGLLTGTILGVFGELLSPLPGALRSGTVVVVGVLLVLVDFGGWGERLPQRRRLVPPTIVSRPPSVGALQFGFEMGTGYRTYSPSSGPLIAVIGVLLIGGLLPGLVTGAGFAGGRTLIPLLRPVGSQPVRWDERMLQSYRLVGAICSAGGLAVILVLIL